MDSYTDARCPPPPREYLESERYVFKEAIKKFSFLKKIKPIQFRVNDTLLDDISARVHQRINYYLFFHGKPLRQSRQIAMKAYWILRYKPLRSLSTTYNMEYDINVFFALHIVFEFVLGRYLKNSSKEIQNIVVNNIIKKYQDDYIRAFSEYDISKEAMMLIPESLENAVQYEIIKANRKT